MAHVDYRVVASAVNDDVAKSYLDWLKTELLKHESFFEGAIAPVVEMMEPAPGTMQPRVVVRFVFRNEEAFARYNEEIGPHLRLSLVRESEKWSTAAGDAPASTPPAGTMAPTAMMTTSTPLEQKVTLSRMTQLVSRLPETGALSPILFGILVIIAAMFATTVLEPTFSKSWQQEPMPKAPAHQAHASPTGGAETGAEPGEGPGAPENPALPAAAAGVSLGGSSGAADGKSEPPATKSELAMTIERQSIGSGWAASYVALVGVLTVVILIAYQITERNVEIYFKRAPSWDDLKLRPMPVRGSSSNANAPPKQGDSMILTIRRRVPFDRRALNRVIWIGGVALIFCMIGIQLAPPRPQVLVDFLSAGTSVIPRGMDLGLRLLLVASAVAAVMLAIGFGTLLLPQQRWDPQPVALSIHARLKSARFLLNAASACLVCGVIQVMMLLQLAAPMDLTGDAAEAAAAFPMNYALASGIMFTIMLAGFYLPTVSSLTAWGHRFVLLNSADKSHEDMVKDLDTYDAGVKAEFKPYLSVFAALAPAGAAVVAKLVGELP